MGRIFDSSEPDVDASGSDPSTKKRGRSTVKRPRIRRRILSSYKVNSDLSSNENDKEDTPRALSRSTSSVVSNGTKQSLDNDKRSQSQSVLHRVQGTLSSKISAIPSQHDDRLSQPARKPRQRLERPLDKIKSVGGLYTASEHDKLVDYCTKFQKSAQLSDYDFAEIVQGPATKEPNKTFWAGTYELLPYRNRLSLRRHLQRRYHNFGVRGSWTLEQDELLHNCVEKLGTSFKKVGEAMNRHWEDCRDRYRNYHCVKDQSLDPWQDGEDVRLRKAVGDSILRTVTHNAEVKRTDEQQQQQQLQTSQPETEQQSSHELVLTEKEASKALLWQAVAEQVKHRSRHQCYLRFNYLRAHNFTNFGTELLQAIDRAKLPKGLVHGYRVRIDYSADEEPAGIRAKVREEAERQRQQSPTSRKRRRRRSIKELLDGDRVDLVNLVRESRVKRDEMIDWRAIKNDNEQFRPFSEETLATEWESLKDKYSTESGRSFDSRQTRKAAKKISIWLERILSEADKSRRWSALRRSETPGRSPSRRKRYKSPMYVTEDEDEGEGQVDEASSVVL